MSYLNSTYQYKSAISLVFPPLVDTNFGTYFPSTAVLSGYLEYNGIKTYQEDLNEDFALYLLKDQILKELSNGKHNYENKDESDNALLRLAAATLAYKKTQLFDINGRHLFNDEQNKINQLLKIVSHRFLIDVSIDQLASMDLRENSITSFYTRFFYESGYINRIGENVSVIGISVPMGPQLVPTVLFIKYIKTLKPWIKIIAGGPSFSLMALQDLENLLLTFPELDAVVRFDGEFPLKSLIDQVENDAWSPHSIPGVSALSEGIVIHNAPNHGPRLDDLPFPIYEKSILNRLADPNLGVIQARGCYWGECSYCDFVHLYQGSSSYRSKTPKRFIEECQHLIDTYNINRFDIITESIPPAFAAKISDLILNNNLDIYWNSFAMVHNLFNRDIFHKMKLAGCEFLVIGLETMNTRVLKLVRKSADKEKNIEFLQNAKKAGIKLKVNLIPNLPTTTYEEAMNALTDIEELTECLYSVAIFPFEATRSSEIGEKPHKYGLQVKMTGQTTGAQAQYASNHLDVLDKSMTDGQLKEVLSRYKAFANGINNSLTKSEIQFANEDHGQKFILANEYFQTMFIDDSLYSLNWQTFDLFKMSNEWIGLLKIIREIQPFTSKEFKDLFQNNEIGENYFSHLLFGNLLIKYVDRK